MPYPCSAACYSHSTQRGGAAHGGGKAAVANSSSAAARLAEACSQRVQEPEFNPMSVGPHFCILSALLPHFRPLGSTEHGNDQSKKQMSVRLLWSVHNGETEGTGVRGTGFLGVEGMRDCWPCSRGLGFPFSFFSKWLPGDRPVGLQAEQAAAWR